MYNFKKISVMRILVSIVIGFLIGTVWNLYSHFKTVAISNFSSFGIADLSSPDLNLIPVKDPFDTGIYLPDWDSITFGNLPALADAGEISFPADLVHKIGYDPSREWIAGDSIASFSFLGDFQNALGIQGFSLKNISELAANKIPLTNFLDYRDLSSLSLEDFGLSQYQEISHLADVIPELRSSELKEMPPILASVSQELLGSSSLNSIPGLEDLENDVISDAGDIINIDSINDVINSGDLSVSDLGEQTLGEVLGKYGSALEGVELGNLGELLGSFSLDSIPGLDELPLEKLENWQQSVLDEVPNLTGVPLGSMPVSVDEVPDSLFARMDVPLDPKEKNRLRSLSGSYQSGFGVDCSTDCMHVELGSLGGGGGQGGDGGNTTGLQWIGGQQLVEGGFGPLGSVNGGKEPTGRNPYGSVFKQVVWKVDPAVGKVQTALYFRYCYRGVPDLGCTPYFLGPIPFLVYAEKQPVFLGIATPSDSGIGLDLPTQVSGVQGVDILTGATGPVPPVKPCPEGMSSDQCVMLNPLPSQSGAGVYSRFRRRRPGHDGQDTQTVGGVKNCQGTVIAPDDGVVIHAGGGYSGYAYTVTIYHPERQIATMSAHLCKVLVSKGQHVTRGQAVGVEGGTGGASPHYQGAYFTHLHFEVHAGANQTHGLDGVQVDPENYQFTSPERRPIQDLFG